MTQDPTRREWNEQSDQPPQYREQQQPREQAGAPTATQYQQPPSVGPPAQPYTQQGSQPVQWSPQAQPQRPPQRQPPQSGSAPPSQPTGTAPEAQTGGQSQPQVGAPYQPQVGAPYQPQVGPQYQPQAGPQYQHPMGAQPTAPGLQPQGQPPTGQPQAGADPGTRSWGTAGGQSGAVPAQQPAPAGAPGSQQLQVQSVGVGEVATTEVVTAAPGDPIVALAGKMADGNVGTVVIVEGDHPVGIVTDRMIALLLADRPDVSEVTAADLMHEDPVVVSGEATVLDVVQTLGDSGIRRAPVVDGEGRLAGIVSLDDVLVLLTAELSTLGGVIEGQIEGR